MTGYLILAGALGFLLGGVAMLAFISAGLRSVNDRHSGRKTK